MALRPDADPGDWLRCGVRHSGSRRKRVDRFAIDSLAECVERRPQKLAARASVEFRVADVAAPDADTLAAMQAFRPETVVCWLMGAPAETTGALPAMRVRPWPLTGERIHRAVAELAGSLASVRALHLVDRTAIPGKPRISAAYPGSLPPGQDIVGIALRCGEGQCALSQTRGKRGRSGPVRRSHPSLKSVVPTLASLLALRKD